MTANLQSHPTSATGSNGIDSHLQAQAYIADRWLFIAIMIILGICVAVQVPYSFVRVRHLPKWWYGFSILGGEAISQVLSPMRTPPTRLLHYRLPIPSLRVPLMGLSLSEALVVLCLWVAGLGIAGWCQMAFLDDASRSTLVIMALVCLTAALGVKSGGVGTWIAKGYTAVNFLHRWTGRLVLLLTTLHVVAYLVVFRQAGMLQQEMRKRENYLGAMAFGGLCVTSLASIGFVRRRFWLLFKFGHHIGILLMLAGLNYHSKDVFPYLMAIWVLVLINATLRAITTRFTSAHVRPLVNEESTLFTVASPNRAFVPGQHVRLRIFSLGWTSIIESHPFTIASADGDGIVLVIKSAGDWTKSLYRLASQREGGRTIRCSIEGPYGGPFNFVFPLFSSVLLVVGGSGISFGLGVAKGVLKDTLEGTSYCQQITLVWIVKRKEHLMSMEAEFNGLISAATKLDSIQPDFRLSIILCHTTRTNKEEVVFPIPSSNTSSICIDVLPKRPNLSSILDDIVNTTIDGGGVGVGSCGPWQLIDNVERLVSNLSHVQKNRVGGVEMHSERFSL